MSRSLVPDDRLGPSRGPRAEAGPASASPSTMVDRPGPFLRFVFRRFFAPIHFSEESAERIRQAVDKGPVVYVLRARSYIEFLYFNYAFRTFDLPLARFANGVRTLIWQPLALVIGYLASLFRSRRSDEAAEMSDHLRREEGVLWFLTNPRPFVRRREPDPPIAETLIALERERQTQGGRPLQLVPMSLIWGKRPARTAGVQPTLVDLVFGEREAPGRLRALFRFLRHFRNAVVKVAPPIDLGEFLSAEERAGGAAEPTLAVLARRLRWTVSGSIERELRVTLGPRRKSARRVRDEVLRRRRLHEAAREVARREGKSEEAELARARKLLIEMASDMRPGYMAGLRVALDAIFRKLYDGIEVDFAGLERVREAARQGPLLLLPSHKSHLDYLVLSYVFHRHDLVPPHIAAGINLSFWPVGHIFRRSGAFFIRRSVKGDVLYQTVLREYMRALLRAGHHIEFFLEGTRSRSGKLLAPKQGLLGMIADAVLEGETGQAKVQCVPISIGYEKILEGRSYAEELAGGEKRKEDLGALIKARRVFETRYGTINVQFDEPFDLREALMGAGSGLPAAGAFADDDQSARRAAVRRVAYRVLDGINRVTAVTPTSVAALAILAKGTRGIARPELARAVDFLVAYAIKSGARLSDTLTGNLPGRPAGRLYDAAAVERAVDLLARGGDLAVVGDVGIDPDQVYYRVPEERRLRLDYYKNAAVHVYADAALVCRALLTLEPPPVGPLAPPADYAEPVPLTALRARTLELSRLLKVEFMYRVGASFDALFDETLRRLIELGALSLSGQRVRVVPALRGEVALLSGAVKELIEAYAVMVRLCEELFIRPSPAAGAEPRAHGLVKDARLGKAGSAVATTLPGPTRTEAELVELGLAAGERAYTLGEVTRREALGKTTLKNAIALIIERGILARVEAAGGEGSAAERYALADPSQLAELGRLIDRMRLGA